MNMSAATREDRWSRALGWLYQLFASHRFPVAALSLLLSYKVLMWVMLLMPVSQTPLGQFAEEFKTWCFGYDPATGKMEKMYVILMITEPLALSGILGLIWWKQLKEAVRGGIGQFAPYVAFGMLTVVAASVGMVALSSPQPNGELPFPAEAIRTTYAPPTFELVDQEGKVARLDQHQGKVVVLTGVYATCGFTCPMIMGQAKRAIAALDPSLQADVTVMAVTLDPERDTPQMLASMAEAQQVMAPSFRLLTGDAKHVNEVLDTMGIARARDPKTGVIDHMNVFLVVDRQGRIAYRFSLGERQEEWLTRALELLVREQPVG
jgi:protein SCO1